MMDRLASRDLFLLMVAGILGAAGVALAAAATHTGATQMLGNASAMCLAHAPAILALVALRHALRAASMAAFLLGPGCLLFTADLVSRHFFDSRLFFFAAPIGGSMLIAGWVAVIAGVFLTALRNRR